MSSSDPELKKGNFLFEGDYFMICRVRTCCFIDRVVGLIQQYYIHIPDKMNWTQGGQTVTCLVMVSYACHMHFQFC
jgi:hypothetical protein